MDKSEAKDLLNELGGDEHAWVDFKVDYNIGGIAPKKAEFIRDMASLANVLSDRKEHYLFVGVDDDGNIVGISDDSDTYNGSGPRHLFSYDDSDIQEIVDSNIDPAPTLSWHTFEDSGDSWGVLVVRPLREPPAVISQHINDTSGNRLIHEGLVFIRKASGKKVAGREELESIIDGRIRQQRDEILDGIHKAVELGPEWIDRLEGTFENAPDVPLATTGDEDEADLAVAQRITREPASTLDGQLNEDIAQWQGRGDDYIEPGPLWEYYANHEELRLDEVAIRFLTQSALKNYQLGSYWIEKTGKEYWRDILLETPNKQHRLERAGKLLLLMNDSDSFDKLIDQSSTDAVTGDLKTCKRKIGNTMDDRVRYLLESNSGYTLKYSDWRRDFQPRSLDEMEIRELIPDIADQLIELQPLYERQKAWDRTREFRAALWDLEVVLGREVFS
ncbi:AlbA family DNA-binding domain-containing protein [Salinarchaeum chitinilyticum]